jgi:hypothetical protein
MATNYPTTCVLTGLYYSEMQKKTTYQAFHYLAVHTRAEDGSILKGYEYSMDEQWGYNIAIPNVPLDWEMLEQYLPFFCVMHGEFDYTRGAIDLHEVDVLGKALDGKDYPIPDPSNLILDTSSGAHKNIVAKAEQELKLTFGNEEMEAIKRIGKMDQPFLLNA